MKPPITTEHHDLGGGGTGVVIYENGRPVTSFTTFHLVTQRSVDHAYHEAKRLYGAKPSLPFQGGFRVE